MPLRIIGAGLGRTGTVTLKVALEQLGVGRCYHMIELLTHPQHLPLWQQVAEGRPDWETLFADYAATADYPACLFWRELAAFYPSAKVILTVRDPEQWFESTQATIFSEQNLQRQEDSPVARITRLIGGMQGDMHDRAAMVAEFRRHNQAVIDALPPERLLVYEASQGWEPLCRFLGVPVPAAPFPHANQRAQFQAMLAESRKADGTIDEERGRRYIAEQLTGQAGRGRGL